MIQHKMASPVGSIYILASENGLAGVYLQQQSAPITKVIPSNKAGQYIKQAVDQLNEYFSGKRKIFDLPLDVHGSGFQRNVWSALTRIPYGKTVAYKDIALRIKNPKAVRAVGSANGKNPFCIVVPCHRVIAADGSIGGYAGGIAMKKKLLGLEQQYAGV